MEIKIHDVSSVTLSAEYLSNARQRVIRIETTEGEICEITLFGNTDDVKHLPMADEYVDYDVWKASRGVVSEDEISAQAQAAE